MTMCTIHSAVGLACEPAVYYVAVTVKLECSAAASVSEIEAA